jgi:hypothetical protein
MRLVIALAMSAAILASFPSDAMEVVTRCPSSLAAEPGAVFFDVQLYHFGEYQIGGE